MLKCAGPWSLMLKTTANASVCSSKQWISADDISDAEAPADQSVLGQTLPGTRTCRNRIVCC